MYCRFLYEDEETMSLVIKNVQPEDSGNYKVTAKNELGDDSAEMTLKVKGKLRREFGLFNKFNKCVLAAPKIKTKLENMEAQADLTLKIPIEIEGVPKPTVLFYKDGQEIKNSERIKVVEEHEKHILVIEKTNLKDTGKSLFLGPI